MQHKRWKRILALKVYQKKDLDTAEILHATSEVEAAEYRLLGLKQPIAVIPNGVEIPPWMDKNCGRRERRVVLCLGRIHPKKGLLNLVKAWGMLRPDGWRVLVAGPDEDGHLAEVQTAIASEGLADDFTFLGEVYGTAKWDLYRQADIFVLPTFSENFGLVVAEALSCGTPAITTKGAPWGELETHHCGWWIDVGVDALVVALRQAMAESDQERSAMGRRGRELVEKKYAWPRIAAQMVHVYEWISQGGSRPGNVLVD